MKLTNNCNSDLGIPDYGQLKPKDSYDCDNWEEISQYPIIQSWVRKGFLNVEAKLQREVKAQPVVEDVPDEKVSEVKPFEFVEVGGE